MDGGQQRGWSAEGARRERGGSANGARMERGWSADGARKERGWSAKLPRRRQGAPCPSAGPQTLPQSAELLRLRERTPSSLLAGKWHRGAARCCRALPSCREQPFPVLPLECSPLSCPPCCRVQACPARLPRVGYQDLSIAWVPGCISHAVIFSQHTNTVIQYTSNNGRNQKLLSMSPSHIPLCLKLHQNPETTLLKMNSQLRR